MRKTFSLLLVTLVLLSMVSLGFAQDNEAVTVIPAGETVKLGLASELGDILGPAGVGIANGGILAVQEFNDNGGLLGFEVELLVEDDRCDGAEAVAVANRFVADPNLVGVVGHACSGATIPASEIYNEARVVMVSPSATAPGVVESGFDVVNRVAYSDSIQGVVLARFIQLELEAESIAILHDNSAYGKGLADVVNATMEELGVEVVIFDAIDPESQDYRPQLTVLAENAPDVIYLGGYGPQAALLVEQMQEVGLEDSIFFSSDGVYGQNFLDIAGDNAEGAYASTGRAVGANEEFISAYEEAFDITAKEQAPYPEESYDAATIILNALVEVAEVDADGNLVIDRNALIAAVRATSEYEGISGLITCSSNGECATPLIDVAVVEDGEWVTLELDDDALQVKFE